MALVLGLAEPATGQLPSLLDRTFDTSVGADNDVFAILRGDSGSCFVAGQFTAYNGTVRGRLAKLTSDGQVDPAYFVGIGANNSIYAIARQADGRILIGGAFTLVHGSRAPYLARLEANGALDTNFSTVATINNELRAIAVQPDGRIVIAGRFTDVSGQSRNRIARLRADGSLDPDFNPGTGANDNIRTLLRLGDGRLLIGGQFTNYNGVVRPRVARLLPTGALDLTFNPGLGADDQVRAIATNSTGQIYIGGDFESYDGTNRSSVARLSASGRLDPAFLPPDSPDDAVRALWVAPDDKLWIGGLFRQLGDIYRLNLARLHTNGTVDTFFDPPGLANDEVFAIESDGANRLLLGGKFTRLDDITAKRLARIRPDSQQAAFSFASVGVNDTAENDGPAKIGVLRRGWLGGSASVSLAARAMTATAGADFDPTIGAVSFAPNETFAYANVAIFDDGIVEGSEWFEVELLNAPGAPPGATNQIQQCRILDNEFPANIDETFLPQFMNGPVLAAVMQADGGIIIGGAFNYEGGCIDSHLARLTPGGAPDCDFLIHSMGSDGNVHAVAMDPEGRTIVGGAFTYFNSVPHHYLVRLKPDGITDPTFSIGTQLNGPVFTVVRQPDGRILIGGQFTRFGAVPRNQLARLHPDGTLDTAFAPLLNDGGIVRALRLSVDGRILVAGDFTQINGVSRRRVARLNADGTLDSSFDPGLGPNAAVFALAVQTDERVLIGGEFDTVGSTPRQRVARLLADGRVDTGFNAGEIRGGPRVNALAIQSDGKVVIGGAFLEVAGRFQQNLARLLPSGALDSAFVPTSGANGEVSSVQVVADGTLLIAGNFTEIGGAPRVRVAKVDPDASLNRISLATAALDVQENAGSVLLEVRRAGPTSTTVAVDYATVAGGALPGSDFVATSGQLVFGPLESVRTISIPLVNDGLPEPTEQFRLVLGPTISGARLGLITETTITVLDNDSGLQILPSIETVREGAPYVPFTVFRQSDGPETITVQFTTVDGTARAGSDYVPTNGVLSFPPGVYERAITVPLFDNPEFEGRETFQLVLSNPTPGAGLGSNRVATVFLEDQDSAFEFLQVYPASEKDGAALVYILRRGTGAEAATVRVRSSGGTATAGADYVPVDRIFTFQPNEFTAWLYVTNLNDGLVEPTETIRLVLEEPTGHSIVSEPGEVSVGIEDNDRGIEFGAPTYFANEFSSAARVVVRRGDDGVGPLTVPYRTARLELGGGMGGNPDGANSGIQAEAGEDYVAQSGTLVLPPGETNAVIQIALRQDLRPETNEIFVIHLEPPAFPGSLGTQATARVIILDDERAGSLDLGLQVNPADLTPFRSSYDRINVATHTGRRLLVGLSSTIARLEPDGGVDDTFRPGRASYFAPLPLQRPDGRILVGGSSSNDFSGVGSYCLQLIDPTGPPASGWQFPINHGRTAAMALLGDGRILIGGDFLSGQFNAPPMNILRVLPDGRLDSTFTPVAFNSFNGFFISPSTVEALAVQPDGRILAGGTFNALSGVARSKLVRILPDGAPDPTFVTPPILGTSPLGAQPFVAALALQADGRVYAGGQFTNIGGATVHHLIRLLPDGSPDPTFQSPLSAIQPVAALALQPDGRLLVAGLTTTPNGWETRGFVARLLPDGQFDSSFDAGMEPDGPVNSIALLPGGDIAIGGLFDFVNGIPRALVARLKGDGLRLSADRGTGGNVRLRLLNTAAGGLTVIEASPNLGDWSPVATNTATGATQEFLIPTADGEPRFYRAWHTAP